MRHIVLAKRWKRILAAFIDFLIISGASLVLFFTAVYPNFFKKDEYDANTQELISLYQQSQLFVTDSVGNYAGKSTYSYSSFSELSDKTLTIGNVTTEHNNLFKDLFIYYTQMKYIYTESGNLDVDGYKNSILKVGSEESNILSFDEITYKVTLINPARSDTTKEFFLQAYEDASTVVNKSPVVSAPANRNTNIIFSTVAMIIPCICVFALIFALIIPLCMRNQETIGKKILSLAVISKSGYKMNKWLLVPRFLVYVIFEYVLGICTFGGCFLISYTMFMFAKNRRCLHDFAASSVVIDYKESIYFETPKEEKYYKDHYEGNK